MNESSMVLCLKAKKKATVNISPIFLFDIVYDNANLDIIFILD